MPGRKKKSPLDAALARLKANQEAMPWPDRRELAASLRQTLTAGEQTHTALALVHLLSDDPQPEVRKEVADLLVYVPEKDLAQLAAKLSGDGSFFVQKAVQRVLDRRRKGAQATQRTRRAVNEVQAQLAAIEQRYGKSAADRARRLADEQLDLLVRQTIHNVWNIMGPLKIDLSMARSQLQTRTPDLKKYCERLANIADGIGFIEHILNEMREYACSPADRHPERIADLVKEARTKTLQLMRAKKRGVPPVTINVFVPENIAAQVSRHMLVMALVHILKNACQALADMADGRAKRIEVLAKVVDGNVEIVVRDTGPGIPAETLDDIRQFIPGKTTTKKGGGAFGLPTASHYVAQHGGKLAIDSKAGEGTTVTITIPMEAEDELA